MAFSKTERHRHASLKGKAGGLLGIEIFGSRSRVQSDPPSYRQGSSHGQKVRRGKPEPVRDQAIFLRRYKIKRRILMKTVVAAAGYHPLPGNDDNSERSSIMADDEGHYRQEDDGPRFRQHTTVSLLSWSPKYT